MVDTVELFRPAGPQELRLVAESGWRRWPPRLSWQPIFYPVLDEAYATQIAREWNAGSPSTGYRGYVTRFRVEREFLDRYPVQRVGSDLHLEYWIPAEELEEFNRHIVGTIEVIAEYQGGPDGEPQRIR